jgi:hypothetical protein
MRHLKVTPVPGPRITVELSREMTDAEVERFRNLCAKFDEWLLGDNMVLIIAGYATEAEADAALAKLDNAP